MMNGITSGESLDGESCDGGATDRPPFENMFAIVFALWLSLTGVFLLLNDYGFVSIQPWQRYLWFLAIAIFSAPLVKTTARSAFSLLISGPGD